MPTRTLISVISLPESTARRETFAEDARSARVAWEFFPALRLPQEPLKYDEKLTIAHFGRPLKSGEIGAYASHFATWVAFLKSDADQLVVLEDDVVVDWEVMRILCQTNLASHDVHSLHLFTTQPIDFDIVRYKFISDHSHLLRVKGLMLGCQAYLLTRKAAGALVREAAVIDAPVDWVTSRYWRLGITNYSLYPFPVFERHGTSTIAHAVDLNYQPSMASRIRRVLWRLSGKLQRLWADHVTFVSPTWGSKTDSGTAFLDGAKSTTP